MEYQIIWSDAAISDLTEIAHYIAQGNPEAARSYGEGILHQIGMLASFPNIGPTYPRRTQGPIREIAYEKHRIFYEVNEAKRRVEVLRIHHSARDIPR
jgi:toxin ParE1/3/4